MITTMIPVRQNFRAIITTSIAMIALMIIYVDLNSKSKVEYDKSTAKIIYLNNRLGNLPVRDAGKYRYMKIENYRFPFEIFVGNDEGDFKPKYENIDNLKEGDIISVYFYETENTKKEGLNRFVQFIDKDNISFFERSDSTRTVAYIIISLSIILLFFGLLMWKLGKIEW